MYVWRSLKRGYSRKDLGISAFKEGRIKFKEQYKDFKDSFKKEHLGKAFDTSYDKIKNNVKEFVNYIYISHSQYVNTFPSIRIDSQNGE
jgi:hypothetical protein